MQNLPHSEVEALTPRFDILANQTAFPRLSEAEVAEAAAFGEKCSFRENDVLFSAGDKPFDSYTILSGRVRVIDISTGERVCFVRYGTGYFTGDIDLFTGRPSVVTIEADTDVEAIRIMPAKLRELFVRKPVLGERFWKSFRLRRQLLLQSRFRGLTVYGDKRDKRTVHALELLYRNDVPHFWFDTSVEENSARLHQIKSELRSQPVIAHGTNFVCECPTRSQLADLAGLCRRFPRLTYEVVIVGAGPAGLGAGVAAASDGFCTLILDGTGPGGQAAASSRIENYAGFPDGIAGRELAHMSYLQALKFGADFVAPVNVARLERADDGLLRVESSEGDCVFGRAVIIATGVAYNSLNIEGLDRLVGLGVFYSATKIEALVCKERHVHVIGGGNSAGQAAMFLSQFTPHVSLIVRGDSLQKSMSSYLSERVLANERIKIHYSTNVIAVEGDSYIDAVHLRNGEDRVVRESTCGLFVFIGAKPRTEFLPEAIARDAKGFLLTGADVAGLPLWTERRSPFAVETSLAGVFACGDCRSSTAKRVAFAIGDGSLAEKCVDEFLDTFTSFDGD